MSWFFASLTLVVWFFACLSWLICMQFNRGVDMFFTSINAWLCFSTWCAQFLDSADMNYSFKYRWEWPFLKVYYMVAVKLPRKLVNRIQDKILVLPMCRWLLTLKLKVTVKVELQLVEQSPFLLNFSTVLN